MTASLTAGLDGIAVLVDGYDASQWLRFSNTVNFI